MRNKTQGISYPFKDSSRGDYLQLDETPVQHTISKLRVLLSTQKGSRMYNRNFGFDFRKYQFEPMDDTTYNAIQSDLKETIRKYDRTIDISKIELLTDNESYIYAVNVFINVRNGLLQNTETLQVVFQS